MGSFAVVPRAPRESLRARFGRNVRAARTAKGLSQEGFADLCNLDRSYIGGVERGDRNVGIDNIERIATALATTAASLMTEP